MLGLLPEILTTQFKNMIPGTELAVTGLAGNITPFLLFCISLIIIIIMLKPILILMNYIQAYLFLMQLRSM